VPASTAQFPGSFASDLRQDHRKYAEDRTYRSIIYTYFTDGWEDTSLWKSAVRTYTLMQNISGSQEVIADVLLVYGIRWNDSNMLPRHHDRRDD